MASAASLLLGFSGARGPWRRRYGEHPPFSPWRAACRPCF